MTNLFSELGLPKAVVDAVTDLGYITPTPVQQQAIPALLSGRDVLAAAQTGTGKTAAFALPVISKMLAAPKARAAKKVRALVLAPTRELAAQIDENIRAYCAQTELNTVLIFGGVNIRPQTEALLKGCDFLIATPGRLLDHAGQLNVDLSEVEFLILDEADRMLDMGFYDDIMQIVKYLPKERQTIMFSATMPAKIQQLAKNILNDPAEVKLAVSKPADKIIQAAYVCYENQKLGIIRHLFAEQVPERVIIFASSKLKVKEVTKALKQMKLNVGEMHSDLEQAQREEVMYQFKAGHINILVATDIVARGIDIDDIRLVINYDVPHDNEDYVHRIGRTARANNDGVAITFVSEKEQGNFRNIERFLDKDIYKIALPAELGEAPEYAPHAQSGKNRHEGKRYRKYDKGNRRNGKK